MLEQTPWTSWYAIARAVALHKLLLWNENTVGKVSNLGYGNGDWLQKKRNQIVMAIPQHGITAIPTSVAASVKALGPV